jgi:hypothetical protein
MVLELCERVVKLLDFRTGEEAQVSRTGSGPGEYRMANDLFATAGDSALIYDPGNRRFLIIGPDAKPVRTFSRLLRPSEMPANAGIVASGFNVTAADRKGWLYARESGIRSGANGRVRMDSVAVEKWNYSSGIRDTVVFFRLLGKPGPFERVPTPPFLTGTQWAVAADGRVALVHPQDYHVDFVSATGVRTNGRPIPFTPIRLSAGHRAEWNESAQPPCGTGPRSVTGADGRVSTVRVFGPPPPAEEDWPDELPPFLANAAVFAPDGMLWVRRTTAAGEPATHDVIDPSGRVVQKVVLEKRAKLLGFGKSSVYVLRVDEDDLQYVQRYALPAVTPVRG